MSSIRSSPHRTPENPFSGSQAAALYHAGRPNHHQRAVARIQSIVGPGRVERGLDVACGTGLSTVALAEIADDVVGIDTMSEMLDLAPQRAGVRYQHARAEQIPYEDDAFDAITVSSGFHWFDQTAFYGEARRVLRPGGWLALYDYYFLGQITDDMTFADWFKQRDLPALPTPPRGPRVNVTLTPAGFVHLGDDEYEDPIELSHHQLVDYLLSQSNGIAALEAGRGLSELRAWLADETERFFSTERRVFRFYGKVTCLSAVGIR